ncbi:MAG: M50 family metallopeptidase [Gemmatimonadetes bacterium]|nr:M50 family metallopeptidase [Gemmatimonadota bacterium]
MMKSHTKRKITFLIGFAAYFSAIWFLWDTPAVYPLKVFVVLLHEISHAMVAVATGGTIDKIVLDPNQGGACYCPGGNAFLTLSAGYLGSLAWGGLLVSAGQMKRINSRWVTGAVGLLVIGLTLAYVRSSFGFWFGLAFGSVLVLGAVRLSVAVNQGILLTLGLTSCLYAILDIKSDVIDRPDLRSDAAMLSELTGIDTVVWGGLWIVIAVLASAWLFQWSYRRA